MTYSNWIAILYTNLHRKRGCYQIWSSVCWCHPVSFVSTRPEPRRQQLKFTFLGGRVPLLCAGNNFSTCLTRSVPSLTVMLSTCMCTHAPMVSTVGQDTELMSVYLREQVPIGVETTGYYQGSCRLLVKKTPDMQRAYNPNGERDLINQASTLYHILVL